LVIEQQQDEVPASVLAFDELESGTFNQYRDLSSKLGGDVKTIFDLVEKVFKAQRDFLLEAVNSTQPSQVCIKRIYLTFF
jgi:hypothetical protein